MTFETYDEARDKAAAEAEAKRRLEVASEAVRELYKTMSALKGQTITVEIDGTPLGLGENTQVEINLTEEGYKTDSDRAYRMLRINTETKLNQDTVRQILNNPNITGETWVLQQKNFIFSQAVNRDGQVDFPSCNKGYTALFEIDERGQARSGGVMLTNVDKAPEIDPDNLPKLLELVMKTARTDERYKSILNGNL